MAGKSRTCKGCRTVVGLPRYLHRDYCEDCHNALTYLSDAELRENHPRLWEQRIDRLRQEVAATGGYVTPEGKLLTVQDIQNAARAEGAAEMREACIRTVHYWQHKAQVSGKQLQVMGLVEAIRALPAERAGEVVG